MLVQLEGLNCALCLQVETDHVIKVACVEYGQEALLFGPEASQEFANVVVDQVVLKHSNCLRCLIVQYLIYRTILEKFRFYNMVLCPTVKILVGKCVQRFWVAKFAVPDLTR